MEESAFCIDLASLGDARKIHNSGEENLNIVCVNTFSTRGQAAAVQVREFLFQPDWDLMKRLK